MSASGLNISLGKATSILILHAASSINDWCRNANGFPNRAYPSFHCKDADSKPACKPMTFSSFTTVRRGIVSVPVHRQGKYSQPIKNQEEDIHGTHLHLTFQEQSLLPVLPTNFVRVRGRTWTTPQGCWQVPHSSRMAKARERHASRQLLTFGGEWNAMQDWTSPPISKPFGAEAPKWGHRSGDREQATLQDQLFTCATTVGLWYSMLIYL